MQEPEWTVLTFAVLIAHVYNVIIEKNYVFSGNVHKSLRSAKLEADLYVY